MRLKPESPYCNRRKTERGILFTGACGCAQLALAVRNRTRRGRPSRPSRPGTRATCARCRTCSSTWSSKAPRWWRPNATWTLNSPQNHGKRKQRRQERSVPSREHKQIAPADTGATDHDRLERDEACHGRDERAQTAQVCAHDQRLPLIGEPRKQHRCRHVADNLAASYRGK